MEIDDLDESIFRLVAEHPDGSHTQSGTGSVLAYKDKLYLLTAKHCLMPAATQAGMQLPTADLVIKRVHLLDQAIRVRHSEDVVDTQGRQVLFRSWMIDDSRALDIAILPLTHAPEELHQFAIDAALLDDSYQPLSGDAVHVAGFPYAKEDTVTTLFTNVVGPDMQPLPDDIADLYFLFDTLDTDLKGISGAPLFASSDNKVVGIAVAQHHEYPLGYALFARFILYCLRQFD
jgi:hypothetical protein